MNETLKFRKKWETGQEEGTAYGNLGNAYVRVGDFQKAIEYHERHLKISKEVGDRAGEGKAYGNLGNAYHSLGDFQKAIEYHERDLKISKEVGDRAGEGRAYGNLGNAFRNLGDFQRAIQYYKKNVIAFDHIRGNLISNDEWKITLGNRYDHINLRLWELQFKEGKVIEALLAADQGRAGALNDLLEFNYGLKGLRPEIGTLSARPIDFASYLPVTLKYCSASATLVGNTLLMKRPNVLVPIHSADSLALKININKLETKQPIWKINHKNK